MMLSQERRAEPFVMLDYIDWPGGVVGGIFRSTSRGVLIRIDNVFKYNPLVTNLIALELVAKMHRYIGLCPAAVYWPISILLDKIPELENQAQVEGMEKLSIPNGFLVESLTNYRLIG